MTHSGSRLVELSKKSVLFFQGLKPSHLLAIDVDLCPSSSGRELFLLQQFFVFELFNKVIEVPV